MGKPSYHSPTQSGWWAGPLLFGGQTGGYADGQTVHATWAYRHATTTWVYRYKKAVTGPP